MRAVDFDQALPALVMLLALVIFKGREEPFGLHITEYRVMETVISGNFPICRSQSGIPAAIDHYY